MSPLRPDSFASWTLRRAQRGVRLRQTIDEFLGHFLKRVDFVASKAKLHAMSEDRVSLHLAVRAVAHEFH
jgi:hypothetical protein